MERERGLIISGNKDVKHAEEILQWLEAVNLPNQVAICTAMDTKGMVLK